MELGGNEVLITGGATGIGLALAQRFVAAGSKVIVCGRRVETLHEAANKVPGLITHLSALFIPQLKAQKNPAIFNVTSGLSFAPFSIMPIYCATKAALHSFTLSLRHQLRRSPIRVVEIIPPAVKTDLGGVGLHTMGADLGEFSDSIFAKIKAGDLEVSFGTAETRRLASRAELDDYFQQMNKD